QERLAGVLRRDAIALGTGGATCVVEKRGELGMPAGSGVGRARGCRRQPDQFAGSASAYVVAIRRLSW
ncbi:hypothetical protein, partial [Nonomuraea sp. NPDC049784]|uniref:hypothetical protein n=1 Tax=Nonomuraea sp. NPDC049784 TaxID=3154361 RepID=UPI0033CE096F